MKKWTNFFICERSGRRFPMSQMVIEPGTGLKVARRYSDGSYSLNRHPQNFTTKRLQEGARLPNARGEYIVEDTFFIVDDDLIPIVDSFGNRLVFQF